MPNRKFLVNVDLTGNQALNMVLQNLATAPSTVGLTAGWVYYNTTDHTTYQYTGLSAPNDWLDLGANYVHPTQTPINETFTGAEVMSTFVTNTTGHVTGLTTRTLTPTNIGLGNVDNTSDADKPISTATQAALDLKQDIANIRQNLTSPLSTTYPSTQAVVDAISAAVHNPVTIGTSNGLSITAGQVLSLALANTTTAGAMSAADKVKLNGIATGANLYVHPTFTGNTLVGAPLTGALVISNVTVTNEGHVTGFATRSLTAANIGAAATNHTHLLATGATDVTATATEVNKSSDISLITSGVAGWVYRLTSPTVAAWGQLKGSEINNDLNWVVINDLTTTLTATWSSQKIQDELDAISQTVTGALINKGAYNPVTDTPALQLNPGPLGILNGWTYVVSTPGTFFGEDVEAGDMVISNVDNPTSLSDWSVINKNIPTIVDASTTDKGIVELATNAETQTGTDAVRAITPAALSSRTATTTRTGLIEIATQAETDAGTDANKAVTPATLSTYIGGYIGGYAANFGNGALTSFDFTHNLGTTDVLVQITEVATGEQVEMQVRRTSTTVVNVQCNVAPTTNQYRVLITKI